MLPERDGLFELIYECIRANWFRYREPDRWPTPSKNWVLRVASEFTYDPSQRFEKQLQKQIAICLENEGWGNDVPTASGLVNSHGRQMNIDLGHRINDGFELVELKLESDTPYCAACQILRYGAIYMLYRLEHDLSRRFQLHEALRAKRIVLEVLAPHSYYAWRDVDLRSLEGQLDRQLSTFATHRTAGLSLSFRFLAFPADFIYQPGMDCELIRDGVRRRASPFAGPIEPRSSSLPNEECMRRVEIRGHAGQQIRSFVDWEEYALPPERMVHWKEGRSAFELGRSWTGCGEPTAPAELLQLLESREGTRRTVIKSGVTEHQTTLPFGDRGPRCHDLALRAERDGCVTTICIEAKADEPFGRMVADELREAKRRPVTRFPERLDWLTRSLLGVPAFKDHEHLILSDVISGLPYQLLAATAGTLLEAQIQEATTAVLLVHEFRTTATVDAKLEANAEALHQFLRLFYSRNGGPDEDLPLRPGEMIGPISITERSIAGRPTMPSEIPLFIGKIRTDRLV
jgi:hypothetical protein